MLSVEALVAGYTSEVDVVRGASVEVASGELVAIVGPNGAGKSTLLKAIFGVVTPKSGRVVLGDADVAGLRPKELVQRRLGFVPQVANVFPTLTVDEHLHVGCLERGRLPVLRERVCELFPRLAERLRQPVGTMSGGERQMVAMARALMAEPQVLLLDEPTAGMAPQAVAATFELVREINRRGVAVMMVEQNARMALAMSHRGYVLDAGTNGVSGRGEALLADPRVAELYLGRAATAR